MAGDRYVNKEAAVAYKCFYPEVKHITFIYILLPEANRFATLTSRRCVAKKKENWKF